MADYHDEEGVSNGFVIQVILGSSRTPLLSGPAPYQTYLRVKLCTLAVLQPSVLLSNVNADLLLAMPAAAQSRSHMFHQALAERRTWVTFGISLASALFLASLHLFYGYAYESDDTRINVFVKSKYVNIVLAVLYDCNI